MAEDKLPEKDSKAAPAAKKKPATKKVAKKKADSVTSKKKVTKKPAAKKAAAKKTTSKKAPAKRASVATPVQSAATDDIPKVVPQPPPVPEHSHAAYDVDDDHDGMSGLLVTAGPLIILGFLILVMSNDRSRESASQPQVPATENVTEMNSGLVGESLKELIILDAAMDLSEAFKEAGLKLPAQGLETNSTAIVPTLEIPAELQNNPWAPQQPGQAAAGNAPPAPPPVPDYNQYNPAAVPQYPPRGQMGSQGAWGQPGQMPGYNPYNPYQRGYPMQPPQGYGMAVNPYGSQMQGYGVPQGYPPLPGQFFQQVPQQGNIPPPPGGQTPLAQ